MSDLWSRDDAEKVCEMLSLFRSEVRQQSGDPCMPKSLLQVFINLQKYACEQCPTAFYFMDKKDGWFKMLHNILNNASRNVQKSGIGTVKEKARVITTQEEETLDYLCCWNYLSEVPPKCNIFLLWSVSVPSWWRRT